MSRIHSGNRRRNAARGACFLVGSAMLFGMGAGTASAGQFDSLVDANRKLAHAATPAPLAPLPEFRSSNGVLDIALEAQPTRVALGPEVIEGATYSGSYGGPILRLKPGDTLRLHLTNRLPQATNVHFHGLAVSPQGHGDNSMHMVAPGDSWDYVIPIAKDHAPGVYWFHTHAHSFAERQLMGGLSGTIVIEGLQDEIPATRPLIERVFALKEFSADPRGRLNRVPKPFHRTIKTINGQLMPEIAIRPGETQLWRFSDQTANTYFRLALAGHRFTVIGRDGRPLATPETTPELMIGPAARADVLVTAGQAGAYTLVAERTTTGPGGDIFPAQDLARMVSAAIPGMAAPAPLGALTLAPGVVQAIPGDRIDARRLVVFSSDPVTGLFFINHATFDHERVDFKVPLGSIEEWTVRNSSDELHIFHIHQAPFQVTEINGRAQTFDGLVDTVNVPIHGEVKIRIAFTDPAIVGRFMFHCHILEHEDKGMMAQIEVYDPKVGPMPEGSMGMDDMGGMHHHDGNDATGTAGTSAGHSTGSAGNANASGAASR